jgi:hypothetical protein
MMEDSKLWNRALAPRKGDKFASARERLRSRLSDMRSHAADLVKMIPKDCHGLTVHDVTHLDALWEMADLIAGDEFDLTPAEAFVFGAAVLIHDAGTSIASYPDGLDQIKRTTEWKDTVASLLRRRGADDIKPDDLSNPPVELYDEIVFSVLRALHARHAEELITVAWKSPTTGEEIRLLEDPQLRQAYGPSIGRIAHSHHWEIARLDAVLRKSVGAAPDLPPEWTLDEIKIACLLRCCDAGHIDNRRAPTMLFALSKPTGISKEHWTFQNKLNKPTRQGNVLIYSGGQDFTIAEAEAWWLCYDAVKMIDAELASCDALLEDSKRATFAAKRVFGAESPAILADQIRPRGWRPVDAEIKVSNPIHLAQTLGGRNLYGQGPFAPIRELLQNGVDAVRARRRYEDRGTSWGRVRLIIEEHGTGADQETWLHVDDTGIGMSERVLVGPLLDFGQSFWNSSLLQEEFPGLESRGIQPIGKYGIGFFAVFLLGQHVMVISKKCDSGASDTRVLEFSSISTRPILREARPGELPHDYSTRVSVKIENPKLSLAIIDASDFPSSGKRDASRRTLLDAVRHLTSALDVEFELLDMTESIKFTHGADWTTSSSDQFLREVLSPVPEDERGELVSAHASLLTTLEDDTGRNYGRAAINMLGPTEAFRYRPSSPSAGISVGGFVYPNLGRVPVPYVGVLVGVTEIATRQFAEPRVPVPLISAWATKQATLIDQSRFQIYDLLQACHTITDIGGDSGPLPFCFCGGEFVSLAKFKQELAKENELFVPVSKRYDDNFQLLSIDSLTTSYFVHEPKSNVAVAQLREMHRGVFTDTRSKELLRLAPVDIEERDFEGGLNATSIGRLFSIALETWNVRPRLQLQTAQIFSGRLFRRLTPRWVVSLNRK